MSIRCFFGCHDYESFGEGKSKLGLINRAASVAAMKLWYGPVSHQSDIYDRLRAREQDEGRLYDPDHGEVHYDYVDKIYDKVCLRCGKIDKKIEAYNRYLEHRAIFLGFLIRHREERQEQARRLINGNS